MKLIGILLTLAVLGYAASVYLDSSNSASSDDPRSNPEEVIDQAKQNADALNQSLQKSVDQLNDSN